jgi:hypothetical protein
LGSRGFELPGSCHADRTVRFIIKEEIVFSKQKKTAVDGHGLVHLVPREPRYNSAAHVCVDGFDGEAFLQNVSSSGFRMESSAYTAIDLGKRYTIYLSPETAANLKPFEVEVEVRWVRNAGSNFSAGFSISTHAANRVLKKYIAYVREH